MRKLLTVAVLAVAMIIMTSAPAQALSWRSFSWGTLTSGDCTMFSGATFTLYSDGTARFEGLVTSGDDHDAWQMWVHLKDANGYDLGWIYDFQWVSPGHEQFVKNLPDNDLRYWWIDDTAAFDKNRFSAIHHLSMDKNC